MIRKLFTKVRNELFFCGLDPAGFNEVRDQVAQTNRKSVVIWSVFAIAFWTYCSVMTFFQQAYLQCRYVYLAGLLCALISLWLAAFSTKLKRFFLYFSMALLQLSLLGAAIGIQVCQPDDKSLTMFVMSVIIPVMLVIRPFTSVAYLLTNILTYAIVARFYVDPDIYVWGLINLIIFSTLGQMMGHIINRARFEREMFALRVAKAAEHERKSAGMDPLTKLGNRRAYFECVGRFAAGEQRDIYVVMADLNGLKVVNDTLGHVAGDEMLIGAAECLTDAFRDHMREGSDEGATLYRTGGDEFCVLFPGSGEDVIHSLNRLDYLTSMWQGSHDAQLSISWGYCKCTNADFDSAFKTADEMMYLNKKKYYEAVREQPVASDQIVAVEPEQPDTPQ